MELEKHGNIYVLRTMLMRSNSAVTDRSWVAEITGKDSKYWLARKFVQRDRYQDRPTKNGDQAFGPLMPGKVYEYRNIAFDEQSAYSYRKSGGMDGFFEIVDEEICEIEKAEVMARMEVIDQKQNL